MKDEGKENLSLYWLQWGRNVMYEDIAAAERKLQKIQEESQLPSKNESKIHKLCRDTLFDLGRIKKTFLFFHMMQDDDWKDISMMSYHKLWKQFAYPSTIYSEQIKNKGLIYRCKKVNAVRIKDYLSYPIISLVPDILLDNAIKFTPEGGRIECTFEYNTEGDLVITMENTCVYDIDEKMQIIFDSWNRNENSKSELIPGLGIGLMLLVRIVDIHEGEVYIDSTKTHQVDNTKYGLFKVSVRLPELIQCEEIDNE